MSAAWMESDRLEGGYDRDLVAWVLTYARPHWRALTGCVVLLLALAALQLVQPWIIKRAIDTAIEPGSAGGPLRKATAMRTLWPLVALYLTAVCGTALVHYVQLLWLRITGQRIITQVRSDAFSHLERLSLAFFDRNPTGRVVTRITNDVEALNEVYTSVLVNLFRDVFFMAGAAILLLRLDTRLALLSFAVLPLVAVTAFVFRRYSRTAWRDMRMRLAMINATLAETFSGMRVIQLFAREDLHGAEFQAINEGYYQAARRLIRVFATFSPALDLLTSVALAAIIWYGGGQVLAGAITVGTLYAFTAYVRRLYEPVNALAEKFNILQSGLASAERIQAFLTTPADVEDPSEPGSGGNMPPARTEIAPSVEFEHVWFAYAPGEWVLRDVSFTVMPGETVAFVGHTGAGKSTIMNLLPRFYDVQRGAVRVHGVDVRQWRQRDLRGRVGTVMQDVFLFAGDIAGNIALGETDIARDDVEGAARLVGADPFIRQLPAGYDEPVVERGMTLSSGQRQLISFARAIAFDPEVLILDEATASVDTETEAALQHAMRAAARGRTTIIVAHRLSTVQDAHRIYVMDHGRIVETGTHDDLLAAGGLYRTLWELQFRSPGVAEA
jgi:ATP-binding cassette, subfamily B, multidrug efflux pump